MRFATACLFTALALAPAAAGEPYTPPTLLPAELVEPSDRLIEDATALLRAAQSREPGAAAPFIGETVTVISGALDMHIPRSVETLGPWIDANAALAELGRNTGGDWYVPEGMSEEDALIDTALQYWEASLTYVDGWARDPLAGDAVCSYALEVFDPAEVAAVAEQLGINSSAFIKVAAETEVYAAVESETVVATLGPGALYALDYDTEARGQWIALHLPEGGTGFIPYGDEGLDKPYAAGICLSRNPDGRWQVTAQSNTSL